MSDVDLGSVDVVRLTRKGNVLGSLNFRLRNLDLSLGNADVRSGDSDLSSGMEISPEAPSMVGLATSTMTGLRLKLGPTTLIFVAGTLIS